MKIFIISEMTIYSELQQLCESNSIQIEKKLAQFVKTDLVKPSLDKDSTIDQKTKLRVEAKSFVFNPRYQKTTSNKNNLELKIEVPSSISPDKPDLLTT